MKGFSLIELLVTITIVSVLAAMAIPLFDQYRLKAKIAEAASDLKNFEVAFHAYLVDNDTFPDDTHIVLPAGMEDLISADAWSATPLGGSYNWEGPDYYPYAGIAFFEPTEKLNTFLTLDKMVDDGNLFSGKFIIGTNGRYVYRID